MATQGRRRLQCAEADVVEAKKRVEFSEAEIREWKRRPRPVADWEAPVAAFAVDELDPADPMEIARQRGPFHVLMHYAARRIQGLRGISYESAYAAAFTDRANVKIKAGMLNE